MSRQPQGSPKPLPGAAAFLGMGTSAAACVGMGVWLGSVADGRFHTSPLFLVLGIFLGLAAAVGSVVALVRRFM